MYLNYKVEIPEKAGITRKAIKSTTYLYYACASKYDPKKNHTIPINATIDKCEVDDPDKMCPKM